MEFRSSHCSTAAFTWQGFVCAGADLEDIRDDEMYENEPRLFPD